MRALANCWGRPTNRACSASPPIRWWRNWFETIADERPDSAHNFATCYYEGTGRGRDFVRARALYRQAADAGWITSSCALGNMLIKAEGGPADIPAGLALCERAAQAGDADAQTDMGTYLLTGEFTDMDIVAARNWLEQASKQNQPNALYLLGQIYWFGDGIGQDRVVAENLWRLAYQAGRSDAAFMIMRALLQRSVSEVEGQTALNPEALPELLEWADRAALEDGRAERREQAQGFANSLRGQAGSEAAEQAGSADGR